MKLFSGKRIKPSLPPVETSMVVDSTPQKRQPYRLKRFGDWSAGTLGIGHWWTGRAITIREVFTCPEDKYKDLAQGHPVNIDDWNAALRFAQATARRLGVAEGGRG